MQKFSGYRTIIFVVISLLLKLLVTKNLISASIVDESLANQLTDIILLLMSVVSDFTAIYFRLKAEKPGSLVTPNNQ